MVSSKSWTWQERHAHVLAYLGLGHGRKALYLGQHGISQWQIYRWRAQVVAGSLEQGLVPRGGVMSSPEENREIARLVRLNEELQAQLAEQERAHEAEVAARDSELAKRQVAVEALGKAIALLHQRSESADGTTGP